MKLGLKALAITAAFLIAGTAQAAPTLMNGSFEAPVTGNYVYNPSVSGVTFNAGSGVQTNGSDWGFADAPDGNQTAFVQSSDNYTGQIVFSLTDLIVGQAYQFGFSAAARPNYDLNPFTVAIDGMNLGSFTVSSTDWQAYTTSAFVATATTGLLSFTGSPTTSGDNDVGLDAVTVTAAVPEPATWALMILGMGAVGFAMRRRSKIKTIVRFA